MQGSQCGDTGISLCSQVGSQDSPGAGTDASGADIALYGEEGGVKEMDGEVGDRWNDSTKRASIFSCPCIGNGRRETSWALAKSSPTSSPSPRTQAVFAWIGKQKRQFLPITTRCHVVSESIKKHDTLNIDDLKNDFSPSWLSLSACLNRNKSQSEIWWAHQPEPRLSTPQSCYSPFYPKSSQVPAAKLSSC